jgi:DNA-entry nuclease
MAGSSNSSKRRSLSPYKRTAFVFMMHLTLCQSFRTRGSLRESPLSSLLDDFDDKQNVEQQDDISSSSDTNAQSSKETEGQSHTSTPSTSESVTHTIDGIPAYSGSPNVAINNNVPTFTAEEITTLSYERYSDLDSLGRCGVVMACIGTDLMPTEDREEIGSVKPSGWVNNRYDSDIVSGGYVYNRSHLIGFQLTGENANEKNLITGTRYFNVEGMLPFENYVADYLKEEPEHHVMYRVTPIYIGNNLVASGVQM